MSDILRRIINAQKSDDNPFFKDAEGRIIEITASQGEVFTGYYQADDTTYYTEKDWLEQQRQEQLIRLAEEEYQAEQKRLAEERAKRELKQKELEARQKREEKRAEKGQPLLGKKFLFGMFSFVGVVLLAFFFWPDSTPVSEATTPDVIVTDTIAEESPVAMFGNGIITGKDVRMRAEPTLKGKIITFFPKEGERILIVQAVNDSLKWARVRRENGTEGWVFGEYVKPL